MRLTVILAAFFLCLFANSCVKKNTDKCNFEACARVAPQVEIDTVEAFLKRNNITNAVKHCSGLYYRIDEPGTGSAINSCSVINVLYDGQVKEVPRYFANPGTYTPQLDLSATILAWQIGIPLIKEGGKITLYIPPTLGYGGNPPPGSGIPVDAMLVFHITGISL